MHHLEKRIAAVETWNKKPTWFVWRNSGETPDEAVARVGGGLGYVVTVIGWLEPVEKLTK